MNVRTLKNSGAYNKRAREARKLYAHRQKQKRDAVALATYYKEFAYDDCTFQLPVLYSKTDSRKNKLVRYQYIYEQGNVCCYCNAPFKDEPNLPALLVKQVRQFAGLVFKDTELTHPIHLHHDHKTGLTIGAVHATCNYASLVLELK